MNDPVSVLFFHAMDNDVYLQYMEDPAKYWSGRRANDAAYDRLRAQLSDPAKEALDDLRKEKLLLDSEETEAAFTAGLAFGLRLLRLL